MKRNALAAPFERGFATQKELEAKGGQGELMQVHYRDEEAMYIQAAPDRVTVIFSTVFREETDRIFGKVFLQVCLDEMSVSAFILNLSRNSSMLAASHPSRTLHKFCTQVAILPSKFVISQACATAKILATLLSFFSPVTSITTRSHRELYPISNSFGITCTIISSAPRHTCIRG